MRDLVIGCGVLLVLACGGESPSACEATGGTVSTASCCTSVSDFPNTCLVGACGCAPANSAPVKVCECPAGQCFDGKACMPIAQLTPGLQPPVPSNPAAPGMMGARR